MKRCSKCGEHKPLDCFNRNSWSPDGHQYTCRPCQLIRNREWAEKNPEKRRELIRNYEQRQENYRNRSSTGVEKSAHNAVYRAIKSGALVRPDVCPECQDPRYKVQAHHHDYNKPLEVEWLCSKCHGRLHAEERKTA